MNEEEILGAVWGADLWHGMADLGVLVAHNVSTVRPLPEPGKVYALLL